jgi:hypothetical protein
MGCRCRVYQGPGLGVRAGVLAARLFPVPIARRVDAWYVGGGHPYYGTGLLGGVATR